MAMTHLPRSGALRTAALLLVASLVVAGAGLLLSGCSDSVGAPGVGASAQTTDALALLPPDAQMVGMMNLAAARQSDALGAVTGDAGLGMMSGNGSADFDEFVRLTGFDPAEDLDRVYVAGSDGASGATQRMAFVAYGRFDRDRIEQYIAGQGEGEFEVSQVDGVPVYTAYEEEGPRPAFALVNDQMVIAGDEATVLDMLGRVGTRGATASAELQSLLDRVAYPDGAWFVTRGLGTMIAGAPSGDAPAADDPAALAMRTAEGMVVSMDFRSDGVPVSAFVLTQSGANTGDVADVVRGGISAAKVGLKDEPAAFDVADRVEVDAESDGIQITGFLTPDFLADVHREATVHSDVR